MYPIAYDIASSVEVSKAVLSIFVDISVGFESFKARQQ